MRGDKALPTVRPEMGGGDRIDNLVGKSVKQKEEDEMDSFSRAFPYVEYLWDNLINHGCFQETTPSTEINALLLGLLIKSDCNLVKAEKAFQRCK